MDEKQIAFLKQAFASGLLIFCQNDIASQEPGNLAQFETAFQKVTKIGEFEGETVAWLEEGMCVPLFTADISDFCVCFEIAPPGKVKPQTHADRILSDVFGSTFANQKLRTAMARYAQDALMDREIAQEAQNIVNEEPK